MTRNKLQDIQFNANLKRSDGLCFSNLYFCRQLMRKHQIDYYFSLKNFRAQFDADLWEIITCETKDVYLRDTPKRPTRLSEGSKVIAEKIEIYRKEKVEFLCEIPSLKATSNEISQTHERSPYIFPVTKEPDTNHVKENTELTFSNVIRILEETYEICRKKATEVLVWLLSDTDRCWNIEVPHSLPVAYAMKGYSLPNQPMREMHEHILDECYKRGIDVVCSCFDGQWIKLATRDQDDRPLTLLQLQRDVYDNACKEKRTAIVKNLSEMVIVKDMEKDVDFETSMGGCLVVSCPLLRKLFTAIRFAKKDAAVKPCNISKPDTGSSEDTLSCLPEEALEVLIDSESTATHLISSSHNGTDGVLDTSETDEIETEHNISSNPTNDTLSRQDTTSISNDDLLGILDRYQNHPKKTISQRWKDKTLEDLQICIKDITKLHKLTHVELNIIIDCTARYQQDCNIPIRKSWNILDKANAISKLIGSGVQKERMVKRMESLKDIAMKVVQNTTKYAPKSKLNNVYAVSLFEESYRMWLADSPFSEKVNVDGIGPVNFFSYPEFNKRRERLEPKCVDSHHLLVNLRVKVCKDGVQGIDKKAWHSVAESDRNIISKSLVVDLIDKQNNAFALRTFSAEVESEMKKLNYYKEANFCMIIREWYEAEDDPGIHALDRMERRMRLKSFLLEDVDFGQYPMYGMYIKGFPRIMYEGFLQRIDTTLQLYSIVKCEKFNQRSISSLVNETFFGELSEMEPTKLGCPKAVSIPRLMSTVTELYHFRSNPNNR